MLVTSQPNRKRERERKGNNIFEGLAMSSLEGRKSTVKHYCVFAPATFPANKLSASSRPSVCSAPTPGPLTLHASSCHVCAHWASSLPFACSVLDFISFFSVKFCHLHLLPMSFISKTKKKKIIIIKAVARPVSHFKHAVCLFFLSDFNICLSVEHPPSIPLSPPC